MRLRPLRARRRDVDDLLQQCAVLVREVAVGDVERVGLGDVACIDQNAAVLLGLGDREIRIPDRPGIDAAIGEGGAGVRRRQIDRCDVIIGQPGLLQGLDHDVMRAGSLGEADALALEVGNGLDCRVLRHQDARSVDDGLGRGIDDRRTRGLGENRRGIADCAVIDAADIHRLHHRRARREFDPFHTDALWLEMIFQGLALPRDNQHAVLLVADTNFLRVRLRLRATGQRG